jgi:hypothetical protein
VATLMLPSCASPIQRQRFQWQRRICTCQLESDSAIKLNAEGLERKGLRLGCRRASLGARSTYVLIRQGVGI